MVIVKLRTSVNELWRRGCSLRFREIPVDLWYVKHWAETKCRRELSLLYMRITPRNSLSCLLRFRSTQTGFVKQSAQSNTNRPNELLISSLPKDSKIFTIYLTHFLYFCIFCATWSASLFAIILETLYTYNAYVRYMHNNYIHNLFKQFNFYDFSIHPLWLTKLLIQS